MRDDRALSDTAVVIGVVGLVVILITILAASIIAMDHINVQKYTNDIVIKSAYDPGPVPYWIIVSDDGTEYLADRGIYYKALTNIGSTARLTYIAYENDECMVIDIDIIKHNSSRCNVHTCGSPIDGDVE